VGDTVCLVADLCVRGGLPWQSLRDYAETQRLRRTLHERDVHLALKALGADRNELECRVELK